MRQASPITVNVYGSPVIITITTVLATREHFAAIHRDCAAEQRKPRAERRWPLASHVDVDYYCASEDLAALGALAGDCDHTLSFVQRALWLQTGESVPMLS